MNYHTLKTFDKVIISIFQAISSLQYMGFGLRLAINILTFQPVTTIFWAKVLCSLAAEDACFRMMITLGVVLIRSLVFHVCVPECSRNGSGMRLYLLAQENFV